MRRKEQEEDSEWEKAYSAFKNGEEARRVEDRLRVPGHGGRGRRSMEPAFSAPGDAGKTPSVSVREV